MPVEMDGVVRMERPPVPGVQQNLIELRAEMDRAEHRFRRRGEWVAAAAFAGVGKQVQDAIDEVEEERRRIERDLHDGVQQRLVVLAVTLGLAREQLAVSEASVSATLQRLGGEVGEIVDELRAFWRGVYPSLLRDRGLPDALRAVAVRAPVPTDVDAPDGARYPAEVEAAVYFVCREALQNAVKHARATHVSITLRGRDAPSFAVIDDGIGFRQRSVAPGSGLRNMRDRIAEIGGELTIRSEPGRGTWISGAVPARRASSDRGDVQPHAALNSGADRSTSAVSRPAARRRDVRRTQPGIPTALEETA